MIVTGGSGGVVSFWSIMNSEKVNSVVTATEHLYTH